MELEKYRDVHPNWHRVASLSQPQARATLKLLLAGVFLDGKLTSGELQALAETWQKLPFVQPALSGESLEHLLAQTHDELEALLEDPERFEGFIESVTEKFVDEENKLAVLRLLAIVLTEDGTDENEHALLYATGHHFGFEYDTVDDVVRAVWESYEESQASASGQKRKKPILKGKHWNDVREKRSYPNPFTSRIV
ncbi:hypothetical protein FIV42_05635 [Persicimonas caeni]|uniref:TerB family tellurite resistance protein n=1 Tax=Persicimonas caeni TaxID=2292766 RepID=A0A4Y6PPI5_PERCE|nr:hypothetical protein [Persicimonas caeni]QDG50228.1 hypothetical protein FIV42_05635 [Persicimonas caeni]QED31449.1 hypothetical protein FRD00_05630 [Persicimonas caeni]